jgi:hypothetical protein
MIPSIEELFDEIDRHFLTPSKLEYPMSFAQKRINKEAWFQGQLFCLFSALQEQGRLSGDWEYEAPLSEVLPPPQKGWIDFRGAINHKPVSFEGKTMYLGWQGDQKVYPSTYFDSGPSAPFFGRDVQKMAELAKIIQCFCMVFVYPYPENPELGVQGYWQKGVNSFREKMKRSNMVVREANTLTLEKYSPTLCFKARDLLTNLKEGERTIVLLINLVHEGDILTTFCVLNLIVNFR